MKVTDTEWTQPLHTDNGTGGCAEGVELLALRTATVITYSHEIFGVLISHCRKVFFSNSANLHVDLLDQEAWMCSSVGMRLGRLMCPEWQFDLLDQDIWMWFRA